MAENRIQYAKDGHIARITINRPEALNAMTGDMIREFRAAVEEAERDHDVRVLILTGAGDAFCAGYDIREFQAMKDLNGIWEVGMMLTGTWSYVRKMSKPTIAAISGSTAGGGFELSLCCDLRIAKKSAKIGSCEVRMHQPTTNASSQLLARLIGESKAKELALTGDVWSAETAAHFGLVNLAVDDNAFEQTVTEWAERIASRSPVAVSMTKELFERLRLVSADTASSLEEEAAIKCYLMDDMQEGFDAFLNKRAPVWKGR